MPFKQFTVKVVIHGFQIIPGTGDDPTRLGRSTANSKEFKSFFLSIQRKRICVLFIHDVQHKG